MPGARHERVDRRDPPPHQRPPGPVGGPPPGPVAPREPADAARTRRPLRREVVAPDLRRVEVALAGEDGHHLAARLAELAQGDDRALRRRPAQLLLEFAQGRGEGVVALLVLALRDRPGALVLPRPERAAHVADEHLDPLRA